MRRQVGDGKTNANERLMTRRKAIQLAPKPSSVIDSGQAQTKPAYGLSGVRRGGRVILFQALVGNVGTCHLDVKGAIQRSGPPKEKSPKARDRGGAARSSEEAVERSWSEGAASSGRDHEATLGGRNA
jgi:hypothetical protein